MRREGGEIEGEGRDGREERGEGVTVRREEIKEGEGREETESLAS